MGFLWYQFIAMFGLSIGLHRKFAHKQFETPKPISRWLTKTRKYWNEYWDSDLAQTAQKVDLPAFYRLFQF